MITEFWETSFRDKQEMWGWEPADTALLTLELFKKLGINKVLIPGFGYGRNAKVFIEHNFEMTGIEISETAIELAKTKFGDSVKVHHGPVSAMPFDRKYYDGIFCYALIHLLSPAERRKLIADCFGQLRTGGYMVFVSISKLDSRYSKGKEIDKDTFETWPGLNLFFYDQDSITSEFGNSGLIDAEIIKEPVTDFQDKPSQRFWYIVCRKDEMTSENT